MVNGAPREVPESTQCTPQGEDSRSPKGFSKGESKSTSKARPKAKSLRGRRPRGFWAFGLAEDVAKKILKRAFNILPGGYKALSG